MYFLHNLHITKAYITNEKRIIYLLRTELNDDIKLKYFMLYNSYLQNYINAF